MFSRVSKACWRLDEWLQQRFGRPYVILLGVGLVIDIGHRMTELREKAASAHGVGLILGIILEFGLLIHQVGELHHHFRARDRKEDEAEG
jgi:hypothetical protein